MSVKHLDWDDDVPAKERVVGVNVDAVSPALRPDQCLNAMIHQVLDGTPVVQPEFGHSLEVRWGAGR